MKRVIISSDLKGIRHFLIGNKEVYRYVLSDGDFTGIKDLLNERGYKREDIENGLGGIDFRKEYIDFIGELNRRYNSIHWLANSISYKGTFVSALHKKIYNYLCLLYFIKDRQDSYIIISSDTVLNDCLSRYCKENRIVCILLDRNKRPGRLTHLKRRLAGAVYFLRDNWLRKLLLQTYMSRDTIKRIKRGKTYYVIKSWIEARSFTADNKYSDVFFGKLPDYMREKGREVLVLGGILTNYKSVVRKLKNIRDPLIIPQEYFVGYLEYLKVLFLTFFNMPRISAPIIFRDIDVTGLIKDALEMDYECGEVQKNLMYYYYVKGLVKKVRVDSFVYTFENQAWERMSLLAFKERSPSTGLAGYAHAAITQSALPYFYSKAEEDTVPFPDRIITTGIEPRLILSAEGRYERKTRILEGCALRYGHIFKKAARTRHRAENILAAFSIHAHYSLKLLDFLLGSFGESNGFKIILRSHPFTPVEGILKKQDLKLSHNFIISGNLRLEDDLKNAGLLLYIDTTSSIEALMRGIPVINVDIKEPIDPDPLFRMSGLKWTVSNATQLREAITHINSMEDDEYRKRYDETVGYIEKYFYPPEERYLESFVDLRS
jgi:hypothetical protein